MLMKKKIEFEGFICEKTCRAILCFRNAFAVSSSCLSKVGLTIDDVDAE